MENKYFLHTRPELIPFVPENIKTVLDVGCAAGAFGQSIKEKFKAVVWGIEPNATAAELAATKLDKVIHANFDSHLDLGSQQFDAIFFNDVLEHLVDSHGALVQAKKYLTDGGSVIASIPNILHFEAIYPILRNRDWKYEEAGVMDKTHLRFFTRKSMIRLFEECGYQVDIIQGINPYSKKFLIYLNKFTFNYFEEFRYTQFAIRASRHV
jgi:2-polyprenyl-3-methyl-5-hydroxy-6-metoxy-1,4-benzoquinol methylase